MSVTEKSDKWSDIPMCTFLFQQALWNVLW